MLFLHRFSVCTREGDDELNTFFFPIFVGHHPKKMQSRFRFLFSAALLFATTIASADEGMWFPQLLQKLNAAEMRLRGLKVPVEEIYSLNKNSMKDAVVLFGGGCTGEIISSKGLLLTNHHCGYDQIQEHSTLEKN